MKNFTRRTVLKMAGGAVISLGMPLKVLGRLADGTLIVQDHRVPAQKLLPAGWQELITERGAKEIWAGEALESIGMPIGGIATGQLYLCGDGTLSCWELFNHHEYQNQGPYSYAKRPAPKQVQFGFAARINGKRWTLDRSGFKDIQFKGEHPIATVSYSDAECPVHAEMVAFSPFIPLNAKDSGLPATIFELRFKNASSAPIEIEVSGLLENACSRSGEAMPATRKRRTKSEARDGLRMLTHAADSTDDVFANPRPRPRADIPLADFEGDTYGDWKVEGEAFGTGPAKGTLPGQQEVTGFVGKGLVNSFKNGDLTTGKLTSPAFLVQRDFVTFKIGGGRKPGKTCINLVVDGKVVRTATGLDDERLEWEAWDVRDLAGSHAQIEIVDADTEGWGHINVDQISLSDKTPTAEELKPRHGIANRDAGTMTLAMLAAGESDPDTEYGFDHRYVGVVRTETIRLSPGETHQVVYILAWNFPKHPNGRNYSNFFKDSGAVASYVAEHYPRLSRETKLWKDTYYDSTLPLWLLDRLHMTVGNLCTGTTEWWQSGRFWSWEGVVCCSGTCTHVWNYEHSMARLFPDLERNVRERQDFGAGFEDATGLVGFRSDREYAADGQCGTILKAYREHLVSPDNKFLRRLYPKIKKALEFLVKRDGNGDGVLEDSQPNTYDIEFFGANTFVGSLYLAALRAGEEMAKEVGDAPFAEQCHAMYQSGREATMKRLWNGEFFIQEVDQSKYTKYQYGPGCLADQLFGQGWAHQVGLGHIYPEDAVKKGLQSIWKYNWAPDVAGQNKRWPPQRPFAEPGEAGLFTCTWPVGGRENEPVLYRDEIWTGIEYQVAGHMVWEGLVNEGLSICRGVHERYHPTKRNPYNEVECSDHYSRAMASWGVFTALSGFEYHGPAGKIGFAPKLNPHDFKSAFTVAEGWGTFAQKVDGNKMAATVRLGWGNLSLSEITLEAAAGSRAEVWCRGHKVDGATSMSANRLTVKLEKPLRLRAGDSLEVRVSPTA